MRTFVMAAELLLIKLLAIVVTVFDLVILIDGVKRDDFALVEFTIGKKALGYNRTIGEHSWLWWTGGVALAGAGHLHLGFLYHPLNNGRRHPSLPLKVGT